MPKERLVPIYAALDPTTVARIREAAEREDRSISSWVRRAAEKRLREIDAEDSDARHAS